MKHSFLKLLVLTLILNFSCQHEDDLGKQNQTSVITQKSTTKIVSGKEIPEVLNFIQSKSNSRMQFILDENNSPKGQYRSHEENLSLTTTLTEQIKQVTNSFGKSNYTFKLIEEETKEGIYFLNLVVKEYKDTFYLYIVKYVADDNWLLTNSMHRNFDTFTGTSYFYTDEGIYFLKTIQSNGITISSERHQCNDDNDDDSDTSDNGNSGGAGNSSDDDPTGDSGPDSGSDIPDSGDPSGSGGGSSGFEIYIIPCPCQGHYLGEACSCPVPPQVIIIPNYSMNDALRHPCDDIDNNCESTTDCEFGWDDNCQCLDEPDENEDVGVIIGTDFYEFNNFISTLDINLQDWINDEENIEIREEIFDFLAEHEFDEEVQDIANEVIGILLADPSLIFDEALLETGFVIIDPDTLKVDPAEELSCFDLTQEAKLTIYVQQPRENTDAVVGPNEVGHAFIGIEQGGIIRQIGYYPDKEVGFTGIGDDYDAAIKTNYDYLYHVSISQNVSNTQLTNIINYAINFPSTYNTNNYACTDFAIAIGNLGGMGLPSTTISHFIFTGRSPGKLGQEIRAMSSTSTTTITTNSDNSPVRQGGCN